MDRERAMEKMIKTLENNGEIRFVSADMDIYIQSIDPKEGYAYITQDGTEIDNSKDAVEWAIGQFGGIQNIGRWE